MAGVQLVVVLGRPDGRPDPERGDVVLEAPPGTPFEAVRERLGDLVAAGDAARAGLLRFSVSGREVRDGDLLGSPPLVRGAVLVPLPPAGPTAATPAPGGRMGGGRASGSQALVPGGDVLSGGGSPDADDGSPEVLLVVSHGPGAGSRWLLRGGHQALGRGDGVAVALEDPGVSRVHAVLRVRGSGVAVRDAGSANGTRCCAHEGGKTTEVGGGWHPLVRGGSLLVGSTVLRLEAPSPGATVSATGDGHLLVDPAPRSRAHRQHVVLDLPAPPVAPVPARTPVVVVVVPLALAVVMALVWSPMALLFGLAAPVVVLATSWGERRAQRRSHAGALVEHERRCALVRQRCALALAADLAVLRATGPDPGALSAQTCRRGPAVFSGHGPLLVRLGTGEVRARVEVREDGEVRAQVHAEAPVLLDLDAVGVLGVVGPPGAARALVASVVLGAAVRRSPHDLAVAVLAGPTPRSEPCGAAPHAWGWVRWLPHATAATGRDDTLTTVLSLVRARCAEDAAPRRPRDRPEHRSRVLVVVEDAAHARRAGGVAELLAHGPGVGVLVVCAGPDTASLPAECGAVLTLSGVGATTGRLVVHADGTDAAGAGASSTCDLLPDLVPASAADDLARALAPLHDATPRSSGAALPTSVRLVEVLADAGLDATDPAALRRAWSREPRSSTAVMGLRDVGGRPAPWTVDLVGDGPHALVAGTTGAGKSELLATLVTSLAVVNAPEELAFVLVDYKGGAAFADLVGLPHVVGLVTDLDAHLTGRALASLGAEVRRRERLLAAAGCRDHAQTLARRAAGDTTVPVLPRLVVVVDEFRVLAEELPDFLGGLVRLAAVGRSLGIHLVLATQRPAGVVSADIRANTALRVALRVQDEPDSTDVVDDPGAAALRSPGRALVRSGPGSLSTVQVARVAVSEAAPTGPAAVAVHEVGREGDPPSAPVQAARPDAPAGGAPTDVVAIVAAVRAAATGMPLPSSPWLAPLPDVVPLTAVGVALPGGEKLAGSGTPADHLVVGVVDLPERQERAPLLLDLAAALLVVGAPRTGRSTTLRTVLAAAARHGGLHVHLVTAPSPALARAEALACVGAHVDPDDHERLLRLLRHLDALVVSRRRDGPTTAHTSTLLLLDDADRLLAPSSDQHRDDVADLVHRLTTDGPAVGVVPVLAGDRRLLAGRWAAAVGQRWLLAAADATDHVMAGVPSRSVPRTMPPGRVLLERDGAWVLGQVALLEDASSQGLAGSVGTRDGPGAPGRAGVGPAPAVPALPRTLSTTALGLRWRSRTPVGPAPGTPGDVAIGVGGDGAGVVALDLSGGSRWLVVGAPGSGRSTALTTLAALAHGAGRAVVVIAPHRSPLARWARGAGLARPDAGDASAVRRALDGAATSRPSVGADAGAAPGGGAVLVLVDDLEHLGGRAGEDVLLAALEGAHPVAVVAAGSGEDVLGAFRGLAVALRRSRRALLLHPVAPGSGEVAGLRLVPPPPGPPGRALLVASGRTTTVQVARAEGSPEPA